MICGIFIDMRKFIKEAFDDYIQKTNNISFKHTDFKPFQQKEIVHDKIAIADGLLIYFKHLLPVLKHFTFEYEQENNGALETVRHIFSLNEMDDTRQYLIILNIETLIPQNTKNIENLQFTVNIEFLILPDEEEDEETEETTIQDIPEETANYLQSIRGMFKVSKQGLPQLFKVINSRIQTFDKFIKIKYNFHNLLDE